MQLTLPAPTGPAPVGTVALHLVDRSRPDPFVPTQPVRELMVKLWYPAAATRGFPLAPWMTPAARAAFEAAFGIPPAALVGPATHGHVGAPVARRAGGHPVLLFSPGSEGYASQYHAVAEDLASHGYVVAAVDHTYEAGLVEFPGGRVVPGCVATGQPPCVPVTDPGPALVADTRFVLDQLARLTRGQPASGEHLRPPAGLRRGLDLSRVGMYGHSLGGATAARMVGSDPRVDAGVNLDGSVFGQVPTVRRPFLLVSSEVDGQNAHAVRGDETWQALWERLWGWRLELRLRETGHHAFADFVVLIPQAAPAYRPPPDLLVLGALDGERSVLLQRVYLRAFFDRHLRHRGHLLDRPSPRFPVVVFDGR